MSPCSNHTPPYLQANLHPFKYIINSPCHFQSQHMSVKVYNPLDNSILSRPGPRAMCFWGEICVSMSWSGLSQRLTEVATINQMCIVSEEVRWPDNWIQVQMVGLWSLSPDNFVWGLDSRLYKYVSKWLPCIFLMSIIFFAACKVILYSTLVVDIISAPPPALFHPPPSPLTEAAS